MSVQGVFRNQYVLKCKNVRNLSERAGQHFSNKSEIQKILKYPMGGGVKPIWDIVPNCPVFKLWRLLLAYFYSYEAPKPSESEVENYWKISEYTEH